MLGRLALAQPSGTRNLFRDAIGSIPHLSQIITPPRGGRQASGDTEKLKELISIHAPAWGATPWKVPMILTARYFNSRPRVGGDYAWVSDSAAASVFQFTPPRGGRQGLRGRLRTGGGISIHAPAWGATKIFLGNVKKGLISIHAPAWGATGECPPSGHSRRPISIHAPAWGATVQIAAKPPTAIFQFTPPRGGRPGN